MRYPGRSLLYNHIADNIDRYTRAISNYEKEMKWLTTKEEKTFYRFRLDNCKEELEEMKDVISFLDERESKKSSQ